MKEVTGRDPLSPSTGWLIWPTMRCARLLAGLSAEGTAVDRSGAGRVMEVYPAAALYRWKLSPAQSAEDPGSYKGPGEDRLVRRKRVVQLLAERTESWLDVASHRERFEQSDDEFDALICALLARAAEVGRTEPIPEARQQAARSEGWIHLPAEGQGIESLV